MNKLRTLSIGVSFVGIFSLVCGLLTHIITHYGTYVACAIFGVIILYASYNLGLEVEKEFWNYYNTENKPTKENQK